MIVLLNGKFLPKEQAKISIFDNGFLYGDGIYDTMRAYGGKIFQLEDHMKRVEKSVKLLGLRLPWSLKKIGEWSQQLVQKNHLQEARVRITVSRGDNGFDFLDCKKPTLCIIAEKLEIPDAVYKKGVTAVTYPIQRVLPEIKTLGLTHMIVTYRFTPTKKAYEALIVDEKGFVREGASTNLFLVKKGVLMTPKNNLLPGLTRKLVIELARKAGFKVVIKDFKAGMLLSADEVFLTNRPRQIIPVVGVNGKKVGKGKPGVMTRKIMGLYQEYVREALGDR